MLIREFRIVMPMTVEEYQVAQLYSVAEASKNETGGGEGIEVKENDPFEQDDPVTPALPEYRKGQYTHKIYHLQRGHHSNQMSLYVNHDNLPYCRGSTNLDNATTCLSSSSKVPGFIKLFAPKGSLDITEKAWNCYPYCKTVVTNPEYMKDKFFINIETLHVADRGESENVHNLTPEELRKREVITIDIGNDSVASGDYKEDEDPSKYKSEKTGRGPLNTKDWKQTQTPVMCCYKLVKCEFVWLGLQKKVESFIMKTERRIFLNFHRQVFCWTDKWHGMTMEDIRAHEDKTKKDLAEQLHSGSVKGTKAID